jgi:heme exporter protein D
VSYVYAGYGLTVVALAAYAARLAMRERALKKRAR